MDIQVDAELEAKLSLLAAQQGREARELVHDALSRYVEDETRFLEGVERGIAAADRGQFIEEEELDARVERMLKR